jgi:hypothetical protein
METEQARRLLAMLQANWTGFATTSNAVDLWLTYLRAHDFGVCARAAAKIVHDDERAPTIARFRDACRGALAELGGRADGATCGLCDDGWVWLQERSEEHPHGVVKPCPNGCQPNPQRGRGARLPAPGVVSPPAIMARMRETLRRQPEPAPLAESLAATVLPDGTKLSPRAAVTVAAAQARMTARKAEAEQRSDAE